MQTAELLLKLWPLLMALLGGAFWMGVLDIRVRQNSKSSERQEKRLDRHAEKQQKMEVDQAGWKSTLEGIKKSIDSINRKLDEK